ncbi:MAG: Unknown protein [uncultured Sulfurovum sp.]|uniref:Uncharacterized protein n=1 Tax=uncultured Sulfurovum sp. TaxID=269237 RepID=A0A6S6TR93_9BACT|nr:MAG: Unknown protein [uncultured Sulfurovum sp.]
MKRLLLTLIILLSSVPLSSGDIDGIKPFFDKVYRTERIGDSYHFLLLDKKGNYYHLFTNKTDTLTANELKSSKLLTILKKKQSWGKAFPKNGVYTVSKGKLYTKLLWNPIKVLGKDKIKYLNKTFYIH